MGFELKSFAPQAIALPLCYNRSPNNANDNKSSCLKSNHLKSNCLKSYCLGAKLFFWNRIWELRKNVFVFALLLSLKVRKYYCDRVSWNPECWSSSLCRSWSAASHASSSTWLSSSRCSPGASLTPSNEGFSRRAQPACKCQLGPTSSGTCPTFWWPWTRQWDFWFTAWPANFFLLN